MVKHIVLFQLAKTLTNEEKQRVMNDFKQGIESLPSKISCIRKIFVGLNINSDEQWDICLESEFDSLEDVRFYSEHQAHKAVAALLKGCKTGRSCVDFEF